jgi:hypothetical protein
LPLGVGFSSLPTVAGKKLPVAGSIERLDRLTRLIDFDPADR